MTRLNFSFWDVDETLCEKEAYTPEQCLSAVPIQEYVAKIQERYHDTIIIIYTGRRDELIPATLEWLRRNNIRWHLFSNQKTPFMGRPGETEYVDVVCKRPDEI